MKAYFTNLPTRTWLLLVVPVVVIAYPVIRIVVPAVVHAVVPEAVRAVFLEDPPWYLGEPSEWEKSVFPRLFSIVSAQQATWQREKAPLAAYLAFVSNAPSPMGGIGSDHIGPRHLLSHASSLQRQDGRCWGDGKLTGSLLAVIATEQKFRCPAKVLQADPRFGPALLQGHEARLAASNPAADIVRMVAVTTFIAPWRLSNASWEICRASFQP